MIKEKLYVMPGFVLLIAITICFFCLEPGYDESEITPELCQKLIQKELDDIYDINKIAIAGIQKLDNMLIAVYYTNDQRQGYLQFRMNGDHYVLYQNRSLIMEATMDVYVDNFDVWDDAGQLSSSHFVIFSRNDKLKNIELWTRTTDGYDLLETVEVKVNPSMYIPEKPDSGKYVLIDKHGDEMVCRYFTSHTVTYTQRMYTS